MTSSTQLIDVSKIEQMVMERFPKLEIESRCKMERDMRNQARQSYRDKLYSQYKEQQKNEL